MMIWYAFLLTVSTIVGFLYYRIGDIVGYWHCCLQFFCAGGLFILFIEELIVFIKTRLKADKKITRSVKYA